MHVRARGSFKMDAHGVWQADSASQVIECTGILPLVAARPHVSAHSRVGPLHQLPDGLESLPRMPITGGAQSGSPALGAVACP